MEDKILGYGLCTTCGTLCCRKLVWKPQKKIIGVIKGCPEVIEELKQTEEIVKVSSPSAEQRASAARVATCEFCVSDKFLKRIVEQYLAEKEASTG